MTDPILHSLTLVSVRMTAVCKVNAAEGDPFGFQQLRVTCRLYEGVFGVSLLGARAGIDTCHYRRTLFAGKNII